MKDVVLTGQLVCADDEEAFVVLRHLPLHIQNTRSEVGCTSFEVRQTADPLVWQVDERFVDAAALEDHRTRVASSQWGRATARIERRYTTDWVRTSRDCDRKQTPGSRSRASLPTLVTSKPAC